MQRGEVRNPIQVQLLVMFTCGVYAMYWAYSILLDLNKGLGREEFVPLKEFVLTVATCGFYGIYLQWRISNAVVEVEGKWGMQSAFDPPILFVLNFVGVGPFFIQQSLNDCWEKGTPGGAGGYSSNNGF